ncbi:plasmid segregation protein ParM domain-containing protein [Escherichia coli]|uniref:plasmid segregation protein ParM domain-containing protein n=1 Tax=Escherichia coli TaxID=562 RepID=UPI0032EBACC1
MVFQHTFVSTNIKLQWQESDETIKQHISPNSFKRGGKAMIKVLTTTPNGEQYSFDPNSPFLPDARSHKPMTYGNTATLMSLRCTLSRLTDRVCRCQRHCFKYLPVEYYDTGITKPIFKNIERKKANLKKLRQMCDTFTQ